MKLRLLVVALLASIISMQATANEWVYDRVVDRIDAENEWGGCFALLGTHDGTDGRFNSTLQLWINPWTIWRRTQRGDDDIFKPLMFLQGIRSNADKSQSRPLAMQEFGLDCSVIVDEYGNCGPDLNEYRTTYALNGGNKAGTWVQSFEYMGASPYYHVHTEEQAEEEVPMNTELAHTYWPDYPTEIFNSDHLQTLSLEFAGIRTFNPGSDRTRFARHHAGWIASFAGARSVKRMLDRCKLFQINGGRWSFAIPDEKQVNASSPPKMLETLNRLHTHN